MTVNDELFCSLIFFTFPFRYTYSLVAQKYVTNFFTCYFIGFSPPRCVLIFHFPSSLHLVNPCPPPLSIILPLPLPLSLPWRVSLFIIFSLPFMFPYRVFCIYIIFPYFKVSYRWGACLLCTSKYSTKSPFH